MLFFTGLLAPIKPEDAFVPLTVQGNSLFKVASSHEKNKITYKKMRKRSSADNSRKIASPAIVQGPVNFVQGQSQPLCQKNLWIR